MFEFLLQSTIIIMGLSFSVLLMTMTYMLISSRREELRQQAEYDKLVVSMQRKFPGSE